MDSQDAFNHLVDTLKDIAFGTDGDPDDICITTFQMIRLLSDAELLEVLDTDLEDDDDLPDDYDEDVETRAKRVKAIERLLWFDADGEPHRRNVTPEAIAAPMLRRLQKHEEEALRFAQLSYDRFGAEFLEKVPGFAVDPTGKVYAVEDDDEADEADEDDE